MFFTALEKEFKLVFRDLHSVLVLFVMPAAFIIIMSLAMQDQLAQKGEAAAIELLLYNASDSKISADIIAEIQGLELLNVRRVDIDRGSNEGLLAVEQLLAGSDSVYLYIPPHYGEQDSMSEVDSSLIGVELWLSPKIDFRSRQLVSSAVKQAVAKAQLAAFLAAAGMPAELTVDKLLQDDAVSVRYSYGGEDETRTPTSVQQSVPAWLIFSMFFVVIPISTTMVTEKQQGTLNRLRTMNVSMELFLCSKIFPYLVINQFQLLLMLLLGVYVVPLLGGDRLVLGDSYGALCLMSLATGFAAVGYGLLVAVIAKTTEQATSIGAVGNILLGAIGGIMVPKFIMPDTMQAATVVSPMSWGLEGFLDVFLSNGGVADVLPEAFMLAAFGTVMLLLSMVIFSKSRT